MNKKDRLTLSKLQQTVLWFMALGLNKFPNLPVNIKIDSLYFSINDMDFCIRNSLGFMVYEIERKVTKKNGFVSYIRVTINYHTIIEGISDEKESENPFAKYLSGELEHLFRRAEDEE